MGEKRKKLSQDVQNKQTTLLKPKDLIIIDTKKRMCKIVNVVLQTTTGVKITKNVYKSFGFVISN